VRVDPATLRVRARAHDGTWADVPVTPDELGFRLESGDYLDGVRRPMHLRARQVAFSPLQGSLDAGVVEAVTATVGGTLGLIDPPADADLGADLAGSPTADFRLEAEAAAPAR
jgi:hypothetical protein